MKKLRTHVTFRLSSEGRRLLRRLALREGITRTAVLERLIRREHRRATREDDRG